MKLGFIGVGKMGSALLEGVLASGACKPDEIAIHDVFQGAVDACVQKTGVVAAGSNAKVVELSDAFVLCVKPHHALETLTELTEIPVRDRLLISVVAGIQIARLEEALDNRHRVIRVMPNTPALVGKGASAFAPGTHATSEDADLVRGILEAVGVAEQVTEPQLDAVTGLSGSGPAYVFSIIEAMADGGVLEGLPRATALRLAAQTVAGAAELVQQTGEHPATLRDNVASPGGTTIAGIAAFEKAGLRSALIEAVRAAAQRSRELGD
ncbi:MAG: pyrroline-5-carboxylate reductase [Verrucomicrobiales bacterium]|jgi:pyrroline-5-carboxylate reductase